MFETVIVATRDRARLTEIGVVAARFGLGALLARLGLARKPENGGDPPGLPERTRQAMEALGPTFVKLGQILATRSDLLGPDWTAELGKLHSSAPTLPFEALRGTVEEALGAPPEQVFATFDPVPLAAASIAQVHEATTQDGAEIILKIRRPGIRPVMEADLRLLNALAGAAERHPAIARFRPREIVRLLGEAILGELDFTQEARNAERIAANFRGRRGIHVPAIYWDWTSETLLAMERIEGVAPRDAATLRAAGIDPSAIAAAGAEAVLDMVLVDGLFHGDPHPGNLLCQPGNRIALLDFGMVGHVSPRRREELLGFVLAITGRDPARLAELLAAWTGAGGAETLMPVAERLVERHGHGPLLLAPLVGDVMALLRDRAFMLPADLVLIFKALVTLDGVLGNIDPGFDLSAAAGRVWRRVLLARFAPGTVQDRLAALLLDLSTAEDNLPRLLRAATRRLSEPPPPSPRPDGRLPLAVLAGAAMIAAALLLT